MMNQKYNEFIFPISKREQICDKPSDTRIWVNNLNLFQVEEKIDFEELQNKPDELRLSASDRLRRRTIVPRRP